MADDNDDNILIESDDDESTHQKRRSKASDFIPKPRLISSHVTKLVSTTSPSSSPSFLISDQNNDKTASERRHSHLSSGVESAQDDERHGSHSSNSLPKSYSINVESKICQAPPRSNGAVTSSSAVHLVQREDSISKDDKNIESTYKRLISDQHGNEEPPSYSDEVSVTNNDHHKGICRVIKHPTIRRNWKVYIGSIILTFLGLGLMVLGLAIGFQEMAQGRPFHGDLKSVVFLIGGIILIIPGGYHSLYMTLAACNIRGFKFSKIPTLR